MLCVLNLPGPAEPRPQGKDASAAAPTSNPSSLSHLQLGRTGGLRVVLLLPNQGNADPHFSALLVEHFFPIWILFPFSKAKGLFSSTSVALPKHLGAAEYMKPEILSVSLSLSIFNNKKNLVGFVFYLSLPMG